MNYENNCEFISNSILKNMKQILINHDKKCKNMVMQEWIENR